MLSVIVPAFNERARLPPTLERLRGWLAAAGEPYEVIVVDDGSSDGSDRLVAEAASAWPELRLCRLERNRGKGAAVRAGMLAAVGDLRLFTDADLSTPIEDLPKLRQQLTGDCAIAIGSRALAESSIEARQRWYRELVGRGGNRLIQLLLLRGVHDTQCGFKLFTDEAAIACFSPLTTERWGFDIEVLVRARRRGLGIAEVPVRWRHVEASRVSPLRDSLLTLLDVLRLRLRLRRL